MTFNSPSVESFDNTVTQMPLWRRLTIITSLAIGLFYSARIATKPVSLDAASVEAVSEPRTCRIEEISLGMRVVGRNPLRHETSSPSKITPGNWRAIHLTMNQNGTEYKLAFLRSQDWLKSASAVQGDTIQFSLPEMGVNGPATVDAIMPCPTIEPDDGTGRMIVTGTMRHLAGNVVDLHVTGLDEPIGVTDTHPIWSETRQQFVTAGQLEAGELLRSKSGVTSQVTRITPHRGPPAPTWNLEVDGEHVYQVAASGLLVHNSCPISIDDALDEANAFMEPGIPVRSLESGSGVQFIQQFMDANGNAITRRAGFDLNPASAHVAGLGPHLNLQTQINGIPITTGPLADPHTLINPSTIRPGDF